MGVGGGGAGSWGPTSAAGGGEGSHLYWKRLRRVKARSHNYRD